MDETEYRLQNPANAHRLRGSVRQMEPLVQALRKIERGREAGEEEIAGEETR